MVYTANSQALAAIEQLVHLEPEAVGLAFVFIEAKIPKNVKVATINSAQLPEDWRNDPPPESIQQIGTAWLESQSTAVLKVPSVLVPNGINYLLNPSHKDFAKIKINTPIDFRFDSRLK